MIRRPLFACVCMLSLGIIGTVFLYMKIALAVFICMAFFIIIVLTAKKGIVLGMIFAISFLTGNILGNVQKDSFIKAEALIKNIVDLEGDVCKFETKTYSTYVYLEKAFVDEKSFPKIIVKISNDEIDSYNLKIGNRVKVEGTVKEFNKARNHGNFDEEKYYHSLGVSMIINSDELKVVDDKINFPEQKLYELKLKIVNSFENTIKSEKAGIFSAIVAGDKSELDEESKQLYQDTGIAHILAISGLHISLIGMGIFGFIRRKLKVLPASVISSAFMVAFCIMSGSSVSAIRATVMFIISLTAILKGKKYDIVTALAFAAAISLISNPFYVTNIGFLMSYAAIISIGVINKWAERFITPKHRLSKLLLSSITITFFSVPIVASTYFQIPLYSVLLNLIVIPMMSLVLGSGVLSGFLGLLSISLGRFFIGTGIYLIYFIEGCSSFFSILPYSVITTGAITAFQLFMYYGILFAYVFVCIWIYSNNRKGKTHRNIYIYMGNIRKIIGGKWIRVALSAFVLFLLALLITGNNSPDKLRIIFFDVDQGDSILIQNTNGNTYMIDGGSTGVSEVGKYRLNSGIKYFGIDKIDYAIVTHPDTDHISGIIEMLNDESSGRIEIENILIPYLPENEKYCDLESLCREKEVNFINIFLGMGFTDGNLRISCLHPSQSYFSQSSNGYSTVLDLSFGEFNGLFVGDLEIDGEKVLLDNKLLDENIDYELLKVSHHGSSSSSSEEFLKTVMPETAIISAGVNNPYGHPSKETLNRLKEIGSEIFVTSEQGEIIIMADVTGKYEIETFFK